MSETAGKLLKNARKSANLTRWQVYQAVQISESVLERWESGVCKPDMEDLYKLEILYHAAGLWYECMQLYSQSFRDHFPTDYKKLTLPISVFNVRLLFEDIMKYQSEIERDIVDGEVDDIERAQEYIKKLEEAISAIANCKIMLKQKGGTTWTR